MSDINLSAIQTAFKRATARAVKKAGTGVLVSEELGIAQSEISRYHNEETDRFIPIDHAFELDLAAGDDIILRTWAKARGYTLVPDEQREELAESVNKIVGKLAKASGDLEHTALEASADNKFTRNEDRDTDRKIAEVEDNLEKLKRAKESLRVV